ncbi:MAG: hypothetical protein IKC80_00365 [Kiritimatiellae bacterium]|nr:hypothetical protein [Kiritimatiellia bacterium]
MRRIIMVLSLIVLAGCSAFQTIGVGSPVVDVSVFVAEGYSLDRAVISAAKRRSWVPNRRDEKTYRLTIVQRKNRCVVDVVLNGNESFSILPVESNITVRKYDQWVQNLLREIIHRAEIGK